MFKINHGIINNSGHHQAVLLCISKSFCSLQFPRGRFYKRPLVWPHGIWSQFCYRTRPGNETASVSKPSILQVALNGTRYDELH